MSEIKTAIILGGNGFVGRAVVEKYLKNNWRVVVPTRIKNRNEIIGKMILHGFEKESLAKFVSNESLLFAFDIELTDKKWLQSDNWLRLLDELNITASSILRIINLIGETSKSAGEILRSNIYTLESVFTLVQVIKSQNKNALFITMGSVVEKKHGKNLPPYEYAKKIAREKIEESGLSDFHFIAHYIKGRGERKMKLAAPILWKRLKFSRKWLFGFKVSVIDVDDLAKIIYHLFEVIKIAPQKRKTIEVNVTSGELLFGEMIKNLLPENKQSMPKTIIPSWLEKAFLWAYATIIPLIKPNDQITRRLASFARRSLINSNRPEMLKFFKTAEEIKKLAINTDNYKVLETKPNLIISHKCHPLIYVLRERTKEELERIVQKALISPD